MAAAPFLLLLSADFTVAGGSVLSICVRRWSIAVLHASCPTLPALRFVRRLSIAVLHASCLTLPALRVVLLFDLYDSRRNAVDHRGQCVALLDAQHLLLLRLLLYIQCQVPG